MCVCVCVCVCIYICVCVRVCVFIHLLKIYLQQQFVGWRATSTGHLPTITLPCRRKHCPSVNSQNVAISLVIRYYRCRDLETYLMSNQKS